ncbi:hypothetical protein [Streptomyces sp. NPDC001292]|uniref:hypothetical protein n=1 Tax=Streptomyces sp. NPDC001292 TaxID=3364558 RepID=UPI00368DA6CF
MYRKHMAGAEIGMRRPAVEQISAPGYEVAARRILDHAVRAGLRPGDDTHSGTPDLQL